MNPNPYDAFLEELLRPIEAVKPHHGALRGPMAIPPMRLLPDTRYRGASIPFHPNALKNRPRLDALPFDPDPRSAQGRYAESPLAQASVEARRPYVHDPIQAMEQAARALPEGLRLRSEKAGLLWEDFALDPARKMGALMGAGDGLDTSRAPSLALRRADAVHKQQTDRRLANLQVAEEDYQAALPKVKPWSAAGIASTAIRSAPDTLAALLAGTLGGGPLAGAMMFGAGGIEEYGSRRLSGKKPLQAAEAGLVAGAAEVAGEALPLGFYLKQIKGLGKREAGRALSRVSRGMINDAAGEMITQGLNIGYQAGVLHEGMPLAEAVDRMLYSGVVGAAMGGTVQGSVEAIRPVVAHTALARGQSNRLAPESAKPTGGPQDDSSPMFSRTRGWEGFPDAVIAEPSGAARRHPDYGAAKAGDIEAASRLVAEVLRPDSVRKIREAIGDRHPTIVAVNAVEAAGKNKIPMAFADAIGRRLGLEIDRKIVQANKVGRGGSDGFHRLAHQPSFDGEVESGDYIIVDDTLTQGGTLAQLKEHIESRGGRVILAAALTGKGYSAKMGLDGDSLNVLRENYGSIEPWWRERFGYGFEGLTESEARYILKSGQGPDALRTQILAAGRDQGPDASRDRGPSTGHGGGVRSSAISARRAGEDIQEEFSSYRRASAKSEGPDTVRDRILAAGQGGDVSADDGPVRPVGEGGAGEAGPEVSRTKVAAVPEAPTSARLSVSEVREVLSDRLGRPLVNRLEQSGRLRIVQGQAALPGQIKGRVRGLHAAGVTTLVAENLTPQNVTGVLLHEGGHGAQARLDTMLGRRYGALVERFQALSHRGGKLDRELAEEAERRAQSEMELRRANGLPAASADLDAERIMYFIELVESAPRNRILLRARQLQRDLVAAFRQWVLARQHLPGPLRHALAQSMTGADFVRLARLSLADTAASELNEDRGANFSRASAEGTGVIPSRGISTPANMIDIGYYRDEDPSLRTDWILDAGAGMTSHENAVRHWNDHGAEFPEVRSFREYVEAAIRFLTSPPPGTLSAMRKNGDIMRYHPGTNTFGVLHANGQPRTMFKPKDPRYWELQKLKFGVEEK